MKLLTERERIFLDMLKGCVSIKDACDFLRNHPDPRIEQRFARFTPNAGRSMLYRLRQKYLEARKFRNQIITYRRASKDMDKWLKPRVRLEENEEEEEEQ